MKGYHTAEGYMGLGGEDTSCSPARRITGSTWKSKRLPWLCSCRRNTESIRRNKRSR